MTVTMIRATLKADAVADAEAAVKALFEALAEAKPDGVRYASSRLDDGETFVAIVALDDPTQNPLAAMPAFVAFQDALTDWLARPPTIEQLDVVGSYRFF
jgi:hypothetical protein